MSQFRLARISLLLAAIGLNAAPVLLTSAHAQAAPAAAAAKPETIRKDMYKLLDPAKVKELMAAKKYAEIQANIAAAEAFADRTPYETYVIDRMKVALGSTTGNDKMAMEALEAVIKSGRAEKSDSLDFMIALAEYKYRAKDFAAATDWFKRYQAESTTPERVRTSLTRAQYFNNDFAGARVGLEAIVADAEKAGKKPELDDLRLLASSVAKLNDKVAYANVVEKLAANHPSNEYWSDLLRRMQTKPTYNQRLQLEVLRLQAVALKELTADEYVVLAELALRGGFFTEAKKAVDAGYAKGVLGKGAQASAHKQLQDRATKGAADDAKTINAGEAAAVAAKTGQPMVNLGYAFVTMDQFDKGIALIEKGIAKGGLKNPEDAKLRLGAAYAMAGKKAEAVKAFSEVKGTDGSGDLARYWTMHLNAPAAVAAAPATASTN
jgi:hypothetical protein